MAERMQVDRKTLRLYLPNAPGVVPAVVQAAWRRAAWRAIAHIKMTGGANPYPQVESGREWEGEVVLRRMACARAPCLPRSPSARMIRLAIPTADGAGCKPALPGAATYTEAHPCGARRANRLL